MVKTKINEITVDHVVKHITVRVVLYKLAAIVENQTFTSFKREWLVAKKSFNNTLVWPLPQQ